MNRNADARSGLVALIVFPMLPVLVVPVLVVLAFSGMSGCYNPTLKGMFKCNTEFADDFQCPDGTTCMSGFCVPKGATLDAGVDKPVVRMDAPVDTPKVDATPTDTTPPPPDTGGTCNMPVAACTPDTTKSCDPACQSGCGGCHQKCSVNTKGTFTCNEPSSGRPRGLLEVCDIASAGTGAQTDNCAPGLVCLVDGCSSTGRCFQFCKADKDCSSAPCTRDVGGGQKVCDVPNVACNPVGANPTDGCGATSATVVCYVSSSITDRTFCDCPFMAGTANSSCSGTRDCFGGLACVNNLCRQVCNLSKGSADCQAGQTCSALNSSAKFGFCSL